MSTTRAFGDVAEDSMVDVSAVNAARPALDEFGVEEEDGAEEAEAEASEDDGGEVSDEEHSGPETAETDESEDESEIDKSDDAAGEVDDAHNKRRTSIADKTIAALEAPIDPGGRPRRRGAGGVTYSDWGQGQRYDTTMYEIQRCRKRRRDVEEDQFNV
jgi:hypothetical protein